MKTSLYKTFASLSLLAILLVASFGSASAATTPSFDPGPTDLYVDSNNGIYDQAWATNIDDGAPADPADVYFDVVCDATCAAKFDTSPIVTMSGNLIFRPKPDTTADVTIDISLTNSVESMSSGITQVTIHLVSLQDPSFTNGGDVKVDVTDDLSYSAAWATNINDGNPNAVDAVSFSVTVGTPSLFSVQPAINSSGNLTFTLPNPAEPGFSLITVYSNNAVYPGAPSSDPAETFNIVVGNPTRIVSGNLSQDAVFGLLPTGIQVKCWADWGGDDETVYGSGGDVDFMTGNYSLTVPAEKSCEIAPYFNTWSGGYKSFLKDIDGNPTTDRFLHSDVGTTNISNVNFYEAGQRSISGVITSPNGMRFPAGLTMKFGKGVQFTGYANNTGATPVFEIEGLPPKSFILHLNNASGFNLTNCVASDHGLCSDSDVFGLDTDKTTPNMPILGSRFYPKPAVIAAIPPAVAPNVIVANTLYGDDTVGNDLVYYPKTYTYNGTIKAFNPGNPGTPVLPALKVFNIALKGFYDDPADDIFNTENDFSDQTISGLTNVTYNAATSAYSIKIPALVKQTAGGHATDNDPAPFIGELAMTGAGYQTFNDLISYRVFNSAGEDLDITAYGDRSVFGSLIGAQMYDGTVINFGGGLSAKMEAGSFVLPYLERKSYTLLPTAYGHYFTSSETTFTQASLAAALTASDFDASTKMYTWNIPKPVSPANLAMNPSDNYQKPVIVWEAAPDANAYQYQFSSVSTFTGSNVYDSSVIDASAFTPGESVEATPGAPVTWITPGMTVYWRVRDSQDGGATWHHWTDKFPGLARSFKAATNAPQPTAFGINGAGFPTFEWIQPANLPTGAKYKIEYRKVAPAAVWVAYPTTPGAEYSTLNGVTALPANIIPSLYEFRMTVLSSASVAISPASDPFSSDPDVR